MSVLRRRSLLLLTSLVLMAGLTLALAREPIDREVVLVARDMTFFEEGSSVSNPTLVVRAGERVRLVLVNEDRGMLHDLSIEALDVLVPVLAGDGSRGWTILEAPETPGRYEYVCTYHERLMRGVLQVLPAGRSSRMVSAS
jgi:plastocyanin